MDMSKHKEGIGRTERGLDLIGKEGDGECAGTKEPSQLGFRGIEKIEVGCL
jgi:hypothetical protein